MPVSVYVARTPALAEMLKDLLLQQGIEATVAPLAAPTWAGSRPWMPRVWIANERDLERALVIVTEFEKPAAEGGGAGAGPKCGEEIEAQFTECWKCGASRP